MEKAEIATTSCKSNSKRNFSRIHSKISRNRIATPPMQSSYLNLIENIDWTAIRPRRGGVIVYTIYEGEFYFGLGTDFKTGELTDFGGGIKYKKDQNAIRGSLREFFEESLAVFGPLNESQVMKCPTICSINTIILFLHIDLSNYCYKGLRGPEGISQHFADRVSYLSEPEISSIVWLNMKEMKSLIDAGRLNNFRLYSVVRTLLATQNFYSSL